VTRSATFDRLLEVWSGGDPADVLTMITADHAGHMLHLEHRQRSARDYPGWIESFREANPNRFLAGSRAESPSPCRLQSALRTVRA